MRPDLLTIQLGEQNATIVKLITSCFDKVKDHDFAGAMACGVGDPRQLVPVWTNLTNNYTTILQQTADHGLAAAAARHRGGRTTRTRTRGPST